jgi:E3 ubiquitin-protein ligase RNF115/126
MSDGRQRDGHLDASGPREVVYCHMCYNEWWKDQDDLKCPRCESEATEIVSHFEDLAGISYNTLTATDGTSHQVDPNNDPRNTRPSRADDSRDIDLLDDHNPWRDVPDPEEGDVEDYIDRSLPGPGFYPSRFSRNRPPYGGEQDHGRGGRDPNSITPVMRDFNSVLGQFIGPGSHPGDGSGAEPVFSPIFRTVEPNQGPFGRRGFNGTGVVIGGGGNGRTFTHQWTFTTGGGGHRDQDGQMHPQADDFATYADPLSPARVSDSGPTFLIISIRGRPDQIASILNGLFGAMAPMTPHGQRGEGGENDPRMAGMPMGLRGFFESLFNPANAVAGDAVYTQEALDRIITTLMEQHPTSNAPGPATEEQIAALPKKKLDEKMLGPELKGECSVCMDDVTVGVEVVELPCHHWFHEACAAAWLKEHNTCPICRKSIGDNSQPAGSASAGNNTNNNPTTNNATRAPSSPPRYRPQAEEPARRSSFRGWGSMQDSDARQARLNAIRERGRISPPRYNSNTTSERERDSPPRPRRFQIVGDGAGFGGSNADRDRERERNRRRERTPSPNPPPLPGNYPSPPALPGNYPYAGAYEGRGTVSSPFHSPYRRRDSDLSSHSQSDALRERERERDRDRDSRRTPSGGDRQSDRESRRSIGSDRTGESSGSGPLSWLRRLGGGGGS